MVGAQRRAFSSVLRASAVPETQDVSITLLRPEYRHLAVVGVLAVGCIVALSATPWLPTRRPHHAAISEAISAQLLGLDRPVANTCGKLYVDVDYEYSGLAGVGHLDNVVGSQDCCTLCQGEPSCKAFTWVQNAHLLTGNPGQCWLKGGEYRASNTKKGVFSAFVRDPAVEATVFAREEAAMKQKKREEEEQLEQESAKKKEIAETGEVERAAEEQKVTESVSTKVTTTLGITTLATPVPLTVVGVLATETATSTTTTSTLASTSTQIPAETSTATSTSTISTTQTSTETSTTTTEKPCCSFEPFLGCGSALNISYFCDVSQKHCEKHCVGKWLPHGAAQLTKGLDVHPPTPPPKPSPPPPRKDNGPCCSFEPLKACGDELAISKFCDISRKRCEEDCAGHWLERGPSEKPDGLNLYD